MKDLREAAARLGLAVEEGHIVGFQQYHLLLVDWNRRVNLTRITDPHEVAIKHFLDSLTCLLVLPSGPRPLTLIDVGSGAGFPGVPLKIVRPELHLTLLESVGKKAAFLTHLVSELGLEGVEVVTGRAEDVGRNTLYRQRFDVAISRAVAPLGTLAEYCLPFVKPGGRMVAMKTAGVEAERQAAQVAITVLGGAAPQGKEVVLPGLSSPRLLVTIEKVRPTPTKYPRTAGTPAKNPIV